MRALRAITLTSGLVAFLVSSSLVNGAQRWGDAERFRVRDETTLTRTLRFSGTLIRTLDVRAISGSIHVIGDDGTDVRLEVRKTIRAERDEDLRDAQRDVLLDFAENAPTVGAAVRDPRGPMCGESWNGRSYAWWDRLRYDVAFDFTVRVPKGTRLRLCTINGREVRVDGTSGDFDVSNVNGRVTMDQVGGSGRATTVNGPVTVSFVTTPREASLFKTVNGEVVVSLPSDLAADLRMKTFTGGLFTDFEVQGLPRTVRAPERRNGRFVYRANEFTTVRVGRGGPELTFETLNGDVRVLRTSR